MVGAGVLGLPFAFSYLGWVFGILWLTTAASVSYYTSWQLAGMHEQDGLRINRYRDLGMRVLGEKYGRLGIVPFQFMVMVRAPAGRPPVECYEMLLRDAPAAWKPHSPFKIGQLQNAASHACGAHVCAAAGDLIRPLAK